MNLGKLRSCVALPNFPKISNFPNLSNLSRHPVYPGRLYLLLNSAQMTAVAMATLSDSEPARSAG